ncbi:MAG: RDD family protein [Lysobacteraceae bacterium]
MLDTVREVHTPEGVALRLPAAGPVPRAWAWAIDAGVRLAILSACSGLLSVLGRAGVGMYLLVLFVVLWGYPVLCEALFDGQTPGKRMMELRVVAGDGAPVGWLAACVRNLLRTVDMLPFGYACGLVAGGADPWGRRLGDLVAGTLVVHAPRDGRRLPAASDAVHAPRVPLHPAEQLAVISFAERAPLLTAERQAELADLAEPATGARGTLGAQRLAGLANWLLGKR